MSRQWFLYKGDKTYSWQSSGDAEIKFLIPSSGTVAIPLEVKSGKNTRSKSLAAYAGKIQESLKNTLELSTIITK